MRQKKRGIRSKKICSEKRKVLLLLMLCAALFTAGCGGTTGRGAEENAVGGKAGETQHETVAGEDAAQSEEEEKADLSKAGEPAQPMPGGEKGKAPSDGAMPGPDGKAGAEETAENAGKEQTEGAASENTEDAAASLYAGKKLSISGDSISTFTGYIPDYYSKFYPEMGEITDVNDTWWMQVVQRTGMELLRNASYSGATVSGQSQDNHDGRYGCGNQRMADLRGEDGSTPDVILILLGANDLLNGIPLGSYDGVSQVPEGNIETFSEAYALMLDKMKTWYPEAEIWCCTAAEVSRWNEAGEKFPFQNEHKLTMKDYNAWIKTIAEEKGTKVIDVYDCGITFENADQYTTEGTHPNAAGAKLIADRVCKAFGA